MQLREHHHSGRVAQRMATTCTRHFAHAVVDNQPAMFRQDGGSSSTDLEPLPRRHGSRQSVMRSKLAQAIRGAALQGRRAVGNPDTLPVKIHLTLSRLARGLLRLRTRKKGTMEHTQFQFSGRVRYRDGKEARILIVHVRQFDAVPMSIRCESQSLPVEEILRLDHRNSSGSGANADRIAGFIEPHTRYPDPRIISLRDQPREEIQFAIWASNGSRIENPFHFMRITGLRLHDHAQALQPEAAHRISSPGCSICQVHLSPRQARIVEMTRLVSSGPLTGIDTTPSSSAG